MTTIIRDIKQFQSWRQTVAANKTVGLVPTMGNLHAGHASLLQTSKAKNDFTVLTIFVNPTQFNDQNDLAHYPRTEEADIALATQLGIDIIFIPTVDMLYPKGYRYQIQENHISQVLEGEIRPGHFSGMLTIVLKLLQLAKADYAYFGEKDYQQLLLVQGLVDEFFIDTQIIGCPIIRNENGLPLSSRNSRLSPEDLHTAAAFSHILKQDMPIDDIKQQLTEKGFTVDYVVEKFNRKLAAVRFKQLRLLDNVH